MIIFSIILWIGLIISLTEWYRRRSPELRLLTVYLVVLTFLDGMTLLKDRFMVASSTWLTLLMIIKGIVVLIVVYKAFKLLKKV
ncbi:MAG: hypothetical protein A3K05_03020 [Candidatus Doudnabacteria bacterium RIFCSPHIGHO2_01_48_18]|uniref:Uncharacterized protein n=1 Tax=Candidatus Doudnabacteria bacterium RIFCSPLOWO2_02_FULL_48_13 TaxID=1817845 RepID=A0A1F5QD42_9BACT|nr:MAG: hypothetical protein A3K05_03020 [Candidatus Doudnabacteria bacterium RIFCSPHIGHO2_01_48_18]OGF00057.1 MAG: hypothetical protein A3J05_02405 [Candidatus Doudnabacteria bacterium RIFCSPLOWO2_02_FULL_48_13]